MRALAWLCLVLVIVLVVVSAYLRLHQAGIGCPDWPACYARIGQQDTAVASMVESAYQRILTESDAPLAWAQPLHRAVASILGLGILGLTLLAFRSRRDRLLCLALLGLTVFLAVIGLRSGGLHSTAIVMGNLAGGFAMAGLLGWLVYRSAGRPAAAVSSRMRNLAWGCVALLVVQILLGGLTSANFAALACTSLPDCHGSFMPGRDLSTALHLNRVIEVSEFGIAQGGPERQAIHKAHRLGAIVTLLALLVLGLMALRSPALRAAGSALLLLVLAEFTLGIASVLTGLPIGLAVAHNWLAVLLLLILLNLCSRLAPVRAGHPPA